MENFKLCLTAFLLAFVILSGCAQPQGGNSVTTPGETAGNVKEFDVVARQFEFEPSTITVEEGDTVRLSITSEDVTHGFAISEFAINEKIEPGKTTNLEFVADKKGTFTFYCSVFCGSGHGNMNGQLVVQ